MMEDSKMKCNNCNGSGFISLGDGIRGLKE